MTERIDHGPGRAADLNTRSAEDGGGGSSNNCGVQTMLRRHTAGDSECHGQRKRNDPDDGSGEQIFAEPFRVVAFHSAVKLDAHMPVWAVLKKTGGQYDY